MKRFLSLVLTLAMVLSLISGICIGVSAEEYTMIEEASLTGTEIPELAVGDTLPALSYSVPAGGNYTVTANWLKNGSDVAEGTLVETGNSYTLQISVIANDGYAFNQDEIVLLINGEECDFVAVDARGDGGFGKCIVTKDYSFQEAIEKVEAFYNIPEMGKPLGEITIPDGVNYTLLPEWWDYNAEDYVPADTVVVKGGIYAAQIRLFPAAGYEFTEDTEVWINGELLEDPDIDFDMIMYWSDNYNFGEPVSAVSITHAEPELGKKFPVPAVTGENCVLEHYDWYDSTADEYTAADAVAEVGHEYYLCVAVEPAPGYQFTDETKVTVNGAEPEDFDIYDTNVYYYSEKYDFRQAITEVSLTCPAPEVGKDLPQIVAPADADYEVSFVWYDEYTGEEATGKVKDGGKYEAYIHIVPKAGGYFAENAKVIFNGEVAEEYCTVYENEIDLYRYYSFATAVNKIEVNYTVPQAGKPVSEITVPQNAHYSLGEDTGWYEYATGQKAEGTFEDGKRYELRADVKMDFGYETAEGAVIYLNGQKEEIYSGGMTEVYIYKYYTFAKPIAKVELPAWPELNVGDQLPEISGEGEHYTYTVEWIGYDADGNELTGDTVVDGAMYYANISVYPEDGYEFVEETEVTLGGKPLSSWSYTGYSNIQDRMVYSFGAVKIIDKIELTTHIPGYGEKGGEVKAAENGGYTLAEALWGVATRDDYEDADEAAKAYTYGDRVLLMVELYADDGCIFSPNVAIAINGKEYELVVIEQWESGVYAVYDLGEVKKPAATPETGDTTPVMLLSFLCLSALAGVSVLLSKRKIAR